MLFAVPNALATLLAAFLALVAGAQPPAYGPPPPAAFDPTGSTLAVARYQSFTADLSDNDCYYGSFGGPFSSEDGYDVAAVFGLPSDLLPDANQCGGCWQMHCLQQLDLQSRDAGACKSNQTATVVMVDSLSYDASFDPNRYEDGAPVARARISNWLSSRYTDNADRQLLVRVKPAKCAPPAEAAVTIFSITPWHLTVGFQKVPGSGLIAALTATDVTRPGAKPVSGSRGSPSWQWNVEFPYQGPSLGGRVRLAMTTTDGVRASVEFDVQQQSVLQVPLVLM